MTFTTTLFKAAEKANEITLGGLQVTAWYDDPIITGSKNISQPTILFDLPDETMVHAVDQEITIDDRGQSKIAVIKDDDDPDVTEEREIKFKMVRRTPLRPFHVNPNPQLAGLDPWDPSLTAEQKSLIYEECKINPAYFIREFTRVLETHCVRKNPQDIGRTRLNVNPDINTDPPLKVPEGIKAVLDEAQKTITGQP